MGNDGNLYYDYVNTNYNGFRSAVTLVSGTEITTGDGTLGNPYVVKID